MVGGEVPCLTLLNNDLTEGVLPGLGADVFPPKEMGWHRRKKSEHYIQLQLYVDEIAELLGIDSWHLMSEWFVSENKCLEKEACRVRLQKKSMSFSKAWQKKYAAHGIERQPGCVIKTNRGTYGLGIMVVTKGEQLLVTLKPKNEETDCTQREVSMWKTSSYKRGFPRAFALKKAHQLNRWSTSLMAKLHRGFTGSIQRKGITKTSIHQALGSNQS